MLVSIILTPDSNNTPDITPYHPPSTSSHRRAGHCCILFSGRSLFLCEFRDDELSRGQHRLGVRVEAEAEGAAASGRHRGGAQGGEISQTLVNISIIQFS